MIKRLLLACVLITVSMAASAQSCTENAIANPQDACGEWYAEQYDVALETVRAAEVHKHHRGQGTTVVQLEPYIPWMKARDGGSSEPLFGDCAIPAGRVDAEKGYEPAGDNCRIKWVQCFDFVEFANKRCSFSHGPRQTHATNVAQGIISMAPDTNLIALKLLPFDGRNYAAAIDWLLTPNGQFDNLSPADYWNVVAVSASYDFGAGRAPGNRDTKVRALFAEYCELENLTGAGGPMPERYVKDWMLAHSGKARLDRVKGFVTHSAKLRDAGILPVFGGHNYLGKREYIADGKKRTDRFVSPNGMAFPGCLRETYGISAVAPDYFKRTNKWTYVASNSHPEVTQLLAPGGAGSFSVPLVSGAVAVLKSANLQPAASLADLERYLSHSELVPAEAGISCIPVQDPFPLGESAALGCKGTELPYTLPVLDLKAATGAAAKDAAGGVSP